METDSNPILAPLDPAVLARHEKTKRELERRKLDRCKVHNFTEKPYTDIYNGYANTVQPHTPENHLKAQGGCFEWFFRYVAEPFATKLVDHVIIQRGEDEVEKINKQRDELGQPKIQRMQKSDVLGRPEFSINNMEVRRPLMKQVWTGEVQEYGMNQAFVQQKQAKLQDTRPADEQLFESIEKEGLVASENPEPQEPINMPVDEPVEPSAPAAPTVTPETSIEDLPMA